MHKLKLFVNTVRNLRKINIIDLLVGCKMCKTKMKSIRQFPGMSKQFIKIISGKRFNIKYFGGYRIDREAIRKYWGKYPMHKLKLFANTVKNVQKLKLIDLFVG